MHDFCKSCCHPRKKNSRVTFPGGNYLRAGVINSSQAQMQAVLGWCWTGASLTFKTWWGHQYTHCPKIKMNEEKMSKSWFHFQGLLYLMDKKLRKICFSSDLQNNLIYQFRKFINLLQPIFILSSTSIF